MQLTKTTKILLSILTAIIIVGGIFLIVKKTKRPAVVVDQSSNQEQENANQEQTVEQQTRQPVENNNQTSEVPITEIDTSNWKTYTNDEFGFSFRYPREWEMGVAGLKSEQGEYLSLDLKLKGKNEFAGVVAFGFHENKDNLAVEDWAKKYIDTKNKARIKEEIINTKPPTKSISLIFDNISDVNFLTGNLFKCSRQKICDIYYGQDPSAVQTHYPQLDTRTKQLQFVVDNIFPTLKFF